MKLIFIFFYLIFYLNYSFNKFFNKYVEGDLLRKRARDRPERHSPWSLWSGIIIFEMRILKKHFGRDFIICVPPL